MIQWKPVTIGSRMLAALVLLQLLNTALLVGLLLQKGQAASTEAPLGSITVPMPSLEGTPGSPGSPGSPDPRQ